MGEKIGKYSGERKMRDEEEEREEEEEKEKEKGWKGI